MRFQREHLTPSLICEISPLLHRHWKEIAHYPDIELDPDWETYQQVEANGMIRIFTVREDSGELVGYSAFIVRRNLHYRGCLQANQDVLFLAPEHRAKLVGVRLIKWCDEELRKEGVQAVYHHVKVKHDFGPMLERLGYEKVEYFYSKRLDQPEGGR